MYSAQKIVRKGSILVEKSLKLSPPLAKNMSDKDKANSVEGIGPRTRSKQAKATKDTAVEAIPAPAATTATDASDVPSESETLVRKSVVAAAVAAASAENEKTIEQLQAKLKQLEEKERGAPPPEGATAEPTAPRGAAPAATKRRLPPTLELPTNSDTELDSEEDTEAAPRRKSPRPEAKLSPMAKPFPPAAAPRPANKPTPSAPRLALTERKSADETSYEDLCLPKPCTGHAAADAFGDGNAAIIPTFTVVLLGLHNHGKGAILLAKQIARLLRDSGYTGSDLEFLSRVETAKWIKDGFVVMFKCQSDRDGFLRSLGERLNDPIFNNKFRPIRYYGRNFTVRSWEERTEFKDHYRSGNGNRSWERGDRGGGNGGFGGRF